MKKTETVLRLEDMYKGDNRPSRWGPDGDNPEYFERSLGGRRVCQLSPEATEFLIDRHCGRNTKTGTLILVAPEGDIRRGEVQVFEDWVLTLKLALDEGVYVYNARTKKCSRPVWSALPEDRTFTNMGFEPVRLVPDTKVYNKKLPTIRTRLFALEE